MKFDIKVKAKVTEVEIETWAQNGKWFASIPDAKLLVTGVSLHDALNALEVALEAQVGFWVTQSMKRVWQTPSPLQKLKTIDFV